jgi:hypothetical protein
MNITWLFGFTSFLLGACLFPITLGFWWPNRDHFFAGRTAGLAALTTPVGPPRRLVRDGRGAAVGQGSVANLGNTRSV